MRKLSLLLLVLPALALADFVKDGDTLPGPKSDLRPLRAGDDPNKHQTAADYNALRDAANSLRDGLSRTTKHPQRKGRNAEGEVGEFRAILQSMYQRLDAADSVFRARFNYHGPGARCEAGLAGTGEEVITYTRTNWAWHFLDPDMTYDMGQAACVDNYAPVNRRGLLVEKASTQYLANAYGSPGTQTTSALPTGYHTAWMDTGSGSMTLTAGTATATGLPCTVTASHACTINVTVSGTVVATMSGRVIRAFVQTGAYRSSPIPTDGTRVAPYTRNAPVVSATSGLQSSDTSWCVSVAAEMYSRPWAGLSAKETPVKGLWHIGSGANSARASLDANQIGFQVFDNAAAFKAATVFLNSGLSPGPHVFTTCNTSGTLSVHIDGVRQAVSVTGAGTGQITTMPSTITMGRRSAGEELDGYISDLVVCNHARAGDCQARPPATSLWGQGFSTWSTSGNTVALIGDSVTAGWDRFQYASNYWVVASVLTDHRFRVVAQAASGGTTSADVLARLHHMVFPFRPDFAMVLIGTNDLAGGIAWATTLANIQSIASQLIASGITPIVSAVVPSNSYSTQQCTDWSSLNAALETWARSNPSVVWTAMGKAHADGTTCRPASGTTTDNVHPSPLGASMMGAALAADIAGLVPRHDGEWLADNDDPANLVGYEADPHMLDTGGTATAGGGSITGVVPRGWELKANGGTLTTSQVARTDGRPGTWYQLTAFAPPSSNQFELVTVVRTGFRADGGGARDAYYAQCEFQADQAWTNATQFELLAEPRTSGDVMMAQAWDLRQGTATARLTPSSGVLRTMPFTLPQVVRKIAVRLLWKVDASTLRIGRCELRRAETY